MGGIELLRKVKILSPQTEVIIVTGFASLETALTAIREGAYDYLTKPFQIEEILHSVKRAKEKLLLVRQNQELLNRLEDAYLEIQDLLNNKQGLSREMERVDSELSKHQEKILQGVYAIRRYQDDLQQKESLLPKNDRGEMIHRIENAARLKDQGKLSEQEFAQIKTRLLE
jgi:YesN/AraC family two-component response regulator